MTAPKKRGRKAKEESPFSSQKASKPKSKRQKPDKKADSDDEEDYGDETTMPAVDIPPNLVQREYGTVKSRISLTT
jgi:hypothetical protein